MKYSRPVDPNGEDEWLICVDCGEGFLFAGRDRQYFAAQGFARPKRCRSCRQARKAARG
jgi:hypothetical protein